MLVPSDVGAAGVAEIEERLRLGYSSVFTEIVRYEPTYVFGKGDPEFRGTRSRASMLVWPECNLGPRHHDGDIITRFTHW